MKQGHLYFLFIVTWNREVPVSSIPGVLAGLSVPCWHHWDWNSHSEKCQQILLLGNVFLLWKWGQSHGGGLGKKKEGKRNGAEWAVQSIPDCGVALGVFNIRHRSLWAEACARSPGNRRDNCRTLKIKEGESLCSESGLGVDPRCLVPLLGALECLSLPSHWALCAWVSCVGFNYLAFLHGTEMQSSWSILGNGAFSFKWALGLLLRPLYLI